MAVNKPKKRKLAPAEIEYLERVLSHQRPFGWFNRAVLDMFLVYLAIALVMAVFGVALVVVVSRFVNPIPLAQLFREGWLAFCLCGPGLAAVLTLIHLTSSNFSNESRNYREAMKASECTLRYFTLTRAWRVLDTGDAESPWLLTEISDGRFIFFSDIELKDAGTPSSECEIAWIPSLKFAVGLKFARGRPLAISDPIINIDGLLKYCEVPTLEPMRAEDLPEEALSILRSK
jgi:hypothetical protein